MSMSIENWSMLVPPIVGEERFANSATKFSCSRPGTSSATSAALVAFAGEVLRFPTCRHFASFLGLTPKERSSGQTRRLGAINKHGDVYLRTLLIHGARAVLVAAKRLKKPDSLRSWALHVHKHRGGNKAAVALANKMARILWAVWRDGTEYRSQQAARKLSG